VFVVKSYNSSSEAVQCIHGLLACQFGIEAVGAALQLEAD
jgi:hypothetical protein